MKFLLLATLVAAASAKVYFKEDFSDGDAWETRWKYSEHAGKEWGKFKLTHGKFYGDESAAKGIQTSEDARFYGVSSAFSSKFSNEGKPLVVQFSVKHEQNIDCGGGYVKLFDDSLKPEDMHGESEYAIMFGPDICGPGTKKVHVIFNFAGKNHLITKDIRCKDDITTHLYTLIVNADHTYEVLIDDESAQKGSLAEDWDILPPKEIKDPEAKKPEDWDDRAKIDDPEDSKPEDWEKPEHIADPDATKPEDWDDEMDGEWEPPMIDNPEYKGEWKARQIDNPAYKGKWEHPMIDNPEYDSSKVDLLGVYKNLNFIGIDLWQVKSGSIFDNFLVTDSVEAAKEEATVVMEHHKEELKMKEEQEEEEKKLAEQEAKSAGTAEDDIEDDFEEDDEDADDVEDETEKHDEL